MSGIVPSLAGVFALSAVFAAALVPLAIRLAWLTGWLDHPEARKLHTHATPLLGGLAVMTATTLGWFAARALGGSFASPAPGLVAGAAIALIVGLWDDRFGMGPRPKLLAQALCGGLLVFSVGPLDLGLGTAVESGIAIFVVIALMNAINFLDNMNGMLGGIVSVSMIGFAILSASFGSVASAPLQLALAGACVGFLPYNYPKARLFLGDAGSLVLGYSLAASLLLALQAAPRGWATLGPPLLVAYPAFDMIFVVIRRLREGRRIDQGGRDHTNHRLASLIQCPKRTVLLIWCSTAALCASGFALSRAPRPLPALLVWGLWIILFLLTGRRLSSVPLAPKA